MYSPIEIGIAVNFQHFLCALAESTVAESTERFEKEKRQEGTFGARLVHELESRVRLSQKLVNTGKRGLAW